MGFGSDFGLDTLFDVGAVAAAPFTGGASLAASPSLSGFATDMLMGALGDLGSAAIGGGLSFLGQSSANQSNLQAAREQMAFQERMANTTYQRAVKDLEAAGLNPMMAYGNIHTSSPSGALGVGAQNTMAGAGAAVAGIKPSELASRSAIQQNLREQNAQIQANTALAASQARKAEQDTATSAASELVNLGTLEVQKAQARSANANAALSVAQAKSVMDDNAKKAMMSNIYDVGEKVTGWAKDKVQRLSTPKSIEIIHNPGKYYNGN